MQFSKSDDKITKNSTNVKYIITKSQFPLFEIISLFDYLSGIEINKYKIKFGEQIICFTWQKTSSMP